MLLLLLLLAACCSRLLLRLTVELALLLARLKGGRGDEAAGTAVATLSLLAWAAWSSCPPALPCD